jgi:signal peptidase I
VTSPFDPGSPEEDPPSSDPAFPEPGSAERSLGPADPFGAGGEAGAGDSAPPAGGDVVEHLRGEARKRGDKKAARRSFWKELPILIVVALIVAVLIKTFLVQAFFIPSGSMNDTLLEGDRVMVNKLAYRFGSPHRGDVIVFDNPQANNADGETLLGALVRHVAESLGLSTPDTALIKRVIAVGGETIQMRDYQVYINGVALDEAYVKLDGGCGGGDGNFGPFVVPQGEVFVMGDNRLCSTDSRVFGPIAESDIVGRAFVRVWPPSRWGGL